MGGHRSLFRRQSRCRSSKSRVPEQTPRHHLTGLHPPVLDHLPPLYLWCLTRRSCAVASPERRDDVLQLKMSDLRVLTHQDLAQDVHMLQKQYTQLLLHIEHSSEKRTTHSTAVENVLKKKD